MWIRYSNHRNIFGVENLQPSYQPDHGCLNSAVVRVNWLETVIFWSQTDALFVPEEAFNRCISPIQNRNNQLSVVSGLGGLANKIIPVANSCVYHALAAGFQNK